MLTSVTIKYQNGDYYDGYYDEKNNKREGVGRHNFADGSFFAGTFKDDLIWKGTLFLKHSNNKESLFHGEFEKGTLFTGKLDGYIIINGDEVHYIGDIIDNLPDGHGTYTNENKDVFFTGEFVKGKRVRGKLLVGEFKYEGEFNNKDEPGKNEI